jgi:hypothetical protein
MNPTDFITIITTVVSIVISTALAYHFHQNSLKKTVEGLQKSLSDKLDLHNKELSDTREELKSMREYKEKLGKILWMTKGAFSREQAKDFLTLYIDFISLCLHSEVYKAIIEIDASTIFYNPSQSIEEVKRSMYQVRGLTSEFRLYNGLHMKSFIENTNPKFKKIIDEGLEEFKVKYNAFKDGHIELSDLHRILHTEIANRGQLVLDVLLNEMYAIYQDYPFTVASSNIS